MQKPTPVRDYRPSPTAIQAIRVAIAALFVAIGVALSPFSVPIFGAKVFPVQSFLNVLGAVFLGPVYAVTHDVDFAATVASRWLVLVAGRLVADDTPARIMANEALLTEAALEPSALHYLDFWLNQRLTSDCTTWGC